MSIRYGQKVTTLVSRKSSFFKKNRFDGLTIKKPRSTNNSSWTRPADWLTMPTITSSEQKIALLMPVFPQGSNFLAFLISGAYTINWGDGNTENVAAGVKAQHVYDYADPDLSATVTSDGYKMAIVTITPQAGQNLTSVNFNQLYAVTGSTFPASSPILEIILSCPSLTSLLLGYCKSLIHFSGINMGLLTSYTSLFSNLTTLKQVSTLYTTATVTDVSGMFFTCSSLVSVPLFNTASVTSMTNMFRVCSSLTSVPLYNTSSVTNISQMFMSCSSLTVVPLFNTAAVTNMTNMFLNCPALTAVPLFNTAAVTTMISMFNGCLALTVVPLFNTAAVTTMTSMFQNCFALTSVPLFNTAAVTTMTSMFQSCSSLTAVPLFNTAAVTNMNNMFLNCPALTAVPLFNTAAVTTMISIFNGCGSLTSVPLFNTAAVTTMTSMFQSCSSLTAVPLFNTAAVTNMNNMFLNCPALTVVPLFNTAAVTTMTNMFFSCMSLVSVPLFNTAAVTTMISMFQNCFALTSVPLFNTAAVTTMGVMFNGCTSLISVPLFNTAAVTNMSNMFNGCIGLATIPSLVSSAVITANFTGIFTACSSLTRGALSGTRFTISYASCKLSQSELESIFTNLGTIGAAGQTLTVSSNWGAPTVVSLAATTAANSTTITMANTTGLAVGMQLTGTNSPLTTARAVSFSAGSVITIANHGLSNDDEVSFATIVTTTGITANKIYYVVNAASGTFQVAATVGGVALTLTGTGSGTMLHRTEIVSITANASIVVSRPMAAAGATTLTFRQLKTGTALLKGWAVTG